MGKQRDISAEERFKNEVRVLALGGIYPAPLSLLTALGSKGRRRTLNGRQVRWRAEVLESLGWKYRDDLPKIVTGVPRRRYQWERP